MKRAFSSPAWGLVAISVVLSLALWSAGTATAQRVAPTGPGVAAVDAERPVAQNPRGSANSRLVGTTSDGRRVVGTFTPLRFLLRPAGISAQGVVDGVVLNRNGTRTTFTVVRTVPVQSIEGVPLGGEAGGAASALVPCDILNLVLGPLDLDLLGLTVSLDRVVLDIVANSGAGNLLGNLLCAVAGLLDGGLPGALGRIVDLLNRILALLRLGG